MGDNFEGPIKSAQGENFEFFFGIRGFHFKYPPPSNRFWPFEGGVFFEKSHSRFEGGGGIPRKISFETSHFQTQSIFFLIYPTKSERKVESID